MSTAPFLRSLNLQNLTESKSMFSVFMFPPATGIYLKISARRRMSAASVPLQCPGPSRSNAREIPCVLRFCFSAVYGSFKRDSGVCMFRLCLRNYRASLLCLSFSSPNKVLPQLLNVRFLKNCWPDFYVLPVSAFSHCKILQYLYLFKTVWMTDHVCGVLCLSKF